MDAAKVKRVDELTERLKNSAGVYLADFTAVDVPTVTAFRDTLREKGIAMKVEKNTLIKRALADAGIEGLDDSLKQPTALILSDSEDPIAPAKILVDFYKKNEDKLPIKNLQFDGTTYPGSEVKNLAKMPGKEELQAQVVQLAMGPSATLIGLVKGPAGQLAGQIKALVEKLEKEAA